MTKTLTPKSNHTSTLKIVGHRGAKGLAPENTVAAIRKALAHSVDEIEIDVRVSKDGIAIVHHDADVQDPSGARLPIRHHTYAEIRQHKPDIATLEEIIEVIDRKIPLQIEVKPGEPTKPVIDILQTYLTKGWHEKDFLVGSFHQRTLMELHAALPAIPPVVIESYSSLRAHWRLRQLGKVDGARLSMRHLWLWTPFIRRVSRNGIQLYAYTLDNPIKARSWAKHGLAGIITDYPDRFSAKQSKR